MTKPDDLDALLAVVGTRTQATAVQTSLSGGGIPSRAQRDIARVVEFGGNLGVHPFEVYVRTENLIRAKEALEAKGIPSGADKPGTPSAFGMSEGSGL